MRGGGGGGGDAAAVAAAASTKAHSSGPGLEMRRKSQFKWKFKFIPHPAIHPEQDLSDDCGVHQLKSRCNTSSSFLYRHHCCCFKLNAEINKEKKKRERGRESIKKGQELETLFCVCFNNIPIYFNCIHGMQ